MKSIRGFEVEWGEGRADIARTRNDVIANTWLPLPIIFYMVFFVIPSPKITCFHTL
jgi:hypothetical protein